MRPNVGDHRYSARHRFHFGHSKRTHVLLAKGQIERRKQVEKHLARHQVQLASPECTYALAQVLAFALWKLAIAKEEDFEVWH
jgi:hypothetical protein